MQYSRVLLHLLGIRPTFRRCCCHLLVGLAPRLAVIKNRDVARLSLTTDSDDDRTRFLFLPVVVVNSEVVNSLHFNSLVQRNAIAKCSDKIPAIAGSNSTGACTETFDHRVDGGTGK